MPRQKSCIRSIAKNVLNTCRFTVRNLSLNEIDNVVDKQHEDGRIPEEVEQLARLCLEMGVPEIDPILIEARLDELSEQQRAEHKKLQVLQERLKNEKDQLASIEEFNRKLESLLEMAKPARPNPMQIELIKKKEAEYRARLARDVSKSQAIVHVEEIERMLDSIESCRKQSIKLESELAIFNKLPADWTLARVEVARAKRELDALLEERDRLLRQKCRN